jgi:dipeptidyl-peptidase-4
MRLRHLVQLITPLAACVPAHDVRPCASASAEGSASEQPADLNFVRALALTRNFKLGTPKSASPTADGKAVLFLRSAARAPRQSLWELDIKTNTAKELLSPDAIFAGPETLSAAEKARRERLRITASGFTSFELSDDGTRVVVTLSGRAILFDRPTGQWRDLATGPGSVVDPRLSNNGKKLAYVRDNDLYALDLTSGQATAVTEGGTERRSHGTAEFIAQEEFDRSRGYWWAPDDSQLLYEEADTTAVEAVSIVDLAHPEKEPDRPAYPRPGKSNASVRLGLVPAHGGKTTWVNWDRDTYPYVVDVKWTNLGPPTLYVMDRPQQHAALLAVDPANGTTSQLLEEHDDAWLNADHSLPKWSTDGTFIWSSERSGHWQLELRDKTGKLVRPLRQPHFVYRSVVDFDPGRGVAFVQGSTDPTESRVYALELATDRLEAITDGVSVKALRFGKHHDVFTSEEITAAGERSWAVRTADARQSRLIAAIPSMAERPTTLREVPIEKVTADNLRVAIVRPRHFDPARKYPVVDVAYGGPHHNTVTAEAFNYARSGWIADATDAIVVSIDAKGTPWRGRDFERALKNAFASVPLDGHVAALRALGARHPEMDLSRVGVLGWSFGGYFSALAILKRPDVYRVGVAGAPVCDWLDYDTAYTERYLGLPDAHGVYQDNAVQTFATPLQPTSLVRPLLIAHGTADDNVFFNNSIKLTDALTRTKRPFEFIPLAGVTHQLAEPAIAEVFWTRAVTFLRDNLR